MQCCPNSWAAQGNIPEPSKRVLGSQWLTLIVLNASSDSESTLLVADWHCIWKEAHIVSHLVVHWKPTHHIHNWTVIHITIILGPDFTHIISKLNSLNWLGSMLESHSPLNSAFLSRNMRLGIQRHKVKDKTSSLCTRENQGFLLQGCRYSS